MWSQRYRQPDSAPPHHRERLRTSGTPPPPPPPHRRRTRDFFPSIHAYYYYRILSIPIYVHVCILIRVYYILRRRVYNILILLIPGARARALVLSGPRSPDTFIITSYDILCAASGRPHRPVSYYYFFILFSKRRPLPRFNPPPHHPIPYTKYYSPRIAGNKTRGKKIIKK